MKINSIKARGFIGIQRGLGLDEVSLDLQGLTGLVAISGPNGAGKTSLLELLHPYRTLASRKKALQHHVCLRDPHKDLTFSLNGDRYRTLVKVDAQSGKQEGFIWKNDEPQVDGKCPAYDAYIEDLLGSPALFFASVFAAQGSKRLNDMTTGELKGLMTEFLRLDELVRHEQTSKAVANMLAGELERANADLRGIEETLEEKRMAASDLEAARSAIQSEREKQNRITADIQRLEKEAADLEKRDPACTSTTCAFIKTALEARDALPGLRKRRMSFGPRSSNRTPS